MTRSIPKFFLTCLIFFMAVSPSLFSCPLEESEEKAHSLQTVFKRSKTIKALQTYVNDCLSEYPQTTLLLVQVEGVITDDPDPACDLEMPPIPYKVIADTPEIMHPKARGMVGNTMVDYLKDLTTKDVPVILTSHLSSPVRTIKTLKLFELIEPKSTFKNFHIKFTDTDNDETFYYGVNDTFVWNELKRLFPHKEWLFDQNYYLHTILTPLAFFSENSAWDQVIIINHNYHAPNLEGFAHALEETPCYASLQKIVLLELNSFIGSLR
jgi:hypothetical protein